MDTEKANDAATRIKNKAAELGFDAARITTPDPPAHAAHAQAWLDAGMHGEMHHLSHRAALRAGRLDDGNLLAETRSVVMVALSYNFEGTGRREQGTVKTTDPSKLVSTGRQRTKEECQTSHAAPIPCSLLPVPFGTVARYARGEDYHKVFREKLRAFARWIAETWPGERARGLADSGPIRERELAARAGIGWQGKHTNLISLDLGNWFFLGTLLTTLPLPPDSPVEERCGTCTRCLAACPTGALVAPMTLDARRCISYLTIELKGPIPLELRPLMGDRIFGCDDCLAACPWNDRARQGNELRLAARVSGGSDGDAAHPNLLDWLALTADEEKFQARFAGTALLRPGRVGLRRNICVALGNVGNTDCLPALADASQTDPSALVREHAAWAIMGIGRRQPATGNRGNTRRG